MDDLGSGLGVGVQPMNSDVTLLFRRGVAATRSESEGRCQTIIIGCGPVRAKFIENAVALPSSSIWGCYRSRFSWGQQSGNRVLANYMTYRGQFPRVAIPIGEDGLGNVYVLVATGPDRGKVYYWDHSVGWEGEAEEYRSRGEAVPDSLKYKCLEQVAPTFTDFVFSLQPDED